MGRPMGEKTVMFSVLWTHALCEDPINSRMSVSRAADCTHIAAHCAAINNLYCNNSNQLRICADIYACVLQLKVFAPQCAFLLYVKLLFILKYCCAALRRSTTIKQICTAMHCN